MMGECEDGPGVPSQFGGTEIGKGTGDPTKMTTRRRWGVTTAQGGEEP